MDFKEILKKDNRFKYQLLDRLLDRMRSDCDYFLGYGHRNELQLWAENSKKQIQCMKDLYNSFSDEDKTEWITMNDILNLEKEMLK